MSREGTWTNKLGGIGAGEEGFGGFAGEELVSRNRDDGGWLERRFFFLLENGLKLRSTE